jgi:hypothetical protein
MTANSASRSGGPSGVAASGLGDLGEVGRPEDARGGHRQEHAIDLARVVKAVHLSPLDAEGLSGPDFLRCSVDGQREGALEHVQRLFETIMAVGRGDERTGGDARLEHGGRPTRIELTERGHALRRTLRASVAAVEEDLSRELGAEAFARLQGLLVALNGTTTVRAFRESTGQRIV